MMHGVVHSPEWLHLLPLEIRFWPPACVSSRLCKKRVQLMSDFKLPIPEWSEFDYVIDRLTAKVKDPRVWETVSRRHTRTHFAFQFVASASAEYGDIFADEHANRCLAYAYGEYTRRMKRDVGDSILSNATKPAPYPQLVEMMKSFDREQRVCIVNQLFAIGTAILSDKPNHAKKLAEEHLYDFAAMLRISTAKPAIARSVTREMRSPAQLLTTVGGRMQAAKVKSLQLISGLEKSEDARLQLIRQLTSQLWVQQTAKFWLCHLVESAQELRSSIVNLWLASDIAFHEKLYHMYTRVVRAPIDIKPLDREAIWFMGHAATIGAISDSITELKSVIAAIKELNPIGLVDATTRHLVNSVSRAAIDGV